MEETQTEQQHGGQKGRLRRIGAVDAMAARELLNLAYQTIEPEDRTQRQLFEALMPELFMLRNKGFSFAQLTGLLNESGFNLQPATVRSYYNEMLTKKQELCEQRLNEEIVVLAKVRELTQGTEVSAIAAKVASVRESQRAAVDSRVSAAFSKTTGTSAPAAPATAVPGASAASAAAPAVGATAARPAEAAKRVAAPPPAAVGGGDAGDEEAESPGGEFGLLAGVGGAAVAVGPGAGFFAMDESGPRVPVVDELEGRTARKADPPPAAAPAAAPAPVEAATLKCAPLREGVMPLAEREGVPPEVYADGLLEHPAIPGLMLSKAARLYSQLLEIIDGDGVIRTETLDEKRFRIKWKSPIPEAETKSKKGFVPLHAETLPTG